MIGQNVSRADQHACAKSLAVELDRANLEFQASEFRAERCWVEEWDAVANDFLKVQAGHWNLARAGQRQTLGHLMKIGVARICQARGANKVQRPAFHFGNVDHLESDGVERTASGDVLDFFVELKSKHLLECGRIERVHQRVPQRPELLSCE